MASIALSGHLAFPQPIPIAPILAAHYAQFPGTMPGGEATTYLLFGATAGARVDAFEAGPVVSHLYAAAGQQRVPRGVLPLDPFDDVSNGRTSTGGLADLALGATAGASTGPCVSIEAVVVSHLRLLSARSHVGGRVGGAVRF